MQVRPDFTGVTDLMIDAKFKGGHEENSEG